MSDNEQMNMGPEVQFGYDAAIALRAAGYRPATHDGILAALGHLVITYGNRRAVEALQEAADYAERGRERGLTVGELRARADEIAAEDVG